MHRQRSGQAVAGRPSGPRPKGIFRKATSDIETLKLLGIRVEATSIRLEAIAIRLEVIATRVEVISIRLEAIAIRLEAIATRVEAIDIRNNNTTTNELEIKSQHQNHIPQARQTILRKT